MMLPLNFNFAQDVIDKLAGEDRAGLIFVDSYGHRRDYTFAESPINRSVMPRYSERSAWGKAASRALQFQLGEVFVLGSRSGAPRGGRRSVCGRYVRSRDRTRLRTSATTIVANRNAARSSSR